MQPSSAEYTVTRTYLEWLVELPWSISTEDHIELRKFRRCLDEDHYDLDKVKKRIVEYMAVRKLKNDKKGRSSVSRARQALVRRRSVARSRARSVASSAASRSVACETKPRSAVTGARTSARCRVASSRASRRRAPQPGLRARRDRQARSRLSGDPASALLEVLDPSRTTRSPITTSR